MARVKTHKARNDIYQKGIKVESAKTKSGFKRDRSVPADKDDRLLVPKGATYYTWTLGYHGTPQISLTYPNKRQLTQSGHQLRLYDFEDAIEAIEASSPEDLQSAVESIISDLEDYKSELESNLESVPEQLQESHVNNERIEALETAIEEFEGIDLDDFEFNEDAEESEEEQMENWVQEKIGELQGISLG